MMIICACHHHCHHILKTVRILLPQKPACLLKERRNNRFAEWSQRDVQPEKLVWRLFQPSLPHQPCGGLL
ncbi:Retinoic Acid-Induced Protein 2 [Manis pentadactyla]|nr:Retinoic Acid-Induced Protein 2 [Manis pentadactyla]